MQRGPAAFDTDFLWDARLDPAVLSAMLIGGGPGESHVRLGGSAAEMTLYIAPDASETLVIRAYSVRIQIALRGFGLRGSPSTLAFLLPGDARLTAQLTSLTLFDRLRIGSTRGRPVDPRIARWIVQLRAVDAHDGGLSMRAIARLIWPHRDADAEWRSGGESLRSMVRRLLADAHRNIDHGYRKFFK